MLPYSQDSPLRVCKSPISVTITGDIALQLRAPPCPPLLGPAGMLGASVPKATIHEHSQPKPREGDVHRSPPSPRNWVVDAETIAEAVQRAPQEKLRGGVAPALRPHAATYRLRDPWLRLGHTLDATPYLDETVGASATVQPIRGRTPEPPLESVRMPAPTWLIDSLGWKPATAKSRATCLRLFGHAVAPNLADVGSPESLRIAGRAYQALGISDLAPGSPDTGAGQSAGAALEVAVSEDLDRELTNLDERRDWQISRSGAASSYAQFRHLRQLQQLLDEEPTLRATIGHDYHVKSDVYVGLPGPAGRAPFLHAAIACKWTIRSDRVQNVRHEFGTLVRNRRGRLPHLALITAEPLPSRVISIARGTGEVDAVYHLLFDELSVAVAQEGSDQQQNYWEEMVNQDRIRPYHSLARDLTLN